MATDNDTYHNRKETTNNVDTCKKNNVETYLIWFYFMIHSYSKACIFYFWKVCLRSIFRPNMTEILPIQRKTLFNQSIDKFWTVSLVKNSCPEFILITSRKKLIKDLEENEGIMVCADHISHTSFDKLMGKCIFSFLS